MRTKPEPCLDVVFVVSGRFAMHNTIGLVVMSCGAAYAAAMILYVRLAR
jgi:hypothetical protein